MPSATNHCAGLDSAATAAYIGEVFFTLEQEVDRLDTATLRPDAQHPLWFQGREVRSDAVPTVMTLSNEGSVLPDFFDAQVKVFSARMRACLLELGVSNFEAYPVRLVDPVAGREYVEFFAINVVGTESRRNLGGSQFGTPVPPSLELFQLAEANHLVAAERVVKALRALPAHGVRFDPIDARNHTAGRFTAYPNPRTRQA